MKEAIRTKLSLPISMRYAMLALLAVGVMVIPVQAFAQGCALCYTQAAASGRQMIEALRSGILILVIPPTLGSVGLCFLVHHKRNQIRRNDAAGSRLDW
jgi:hypothetical protein